MAEYARPREICNFCPKTSFTVLKTKNPRDSESKNMTTIRTFLRNLNGPAAPKRPKPDRRESTTNSIYQVNPFSFACIQALLLGISVSGIQAGTMTDAFASRPRESGRTAVFAGNSKSATREAGEPDHKSKRGRTLWAEWTASESGWVTSDTLGTVFPNSAISVYVG